MGVSAANKFVVKMDWSGLAVANKRFQSIEIYWKLNLFFTFNF